MGRLARPKWLSLFNEELELQGYKPVHPADVEATYMSMINLDKKRLQKALADETQPILVKIIAEHLLWDNSFDTLEKVLDRWMWKAIQRNENLNKEIVVTVRNYDWIE